MVHPITALRWLDQVQRLPQARAFDPRRVLDELERELTLPAGAPLDQLGDGLDTLASALVEIDRFAQRCARIYLAHALAATPAPPQLYTLFATTVLSYADQLALLRQRVAGALVRIAPEAATAARVTDAVVESLERVLADRAALRDGVLAIARRLAAAQLPSARGAARDRSLSDERRQQWGRARVDLEAIGERPETVAAGSFTERLQRMPSPPEEPEPEVEPTKGRFSLIEID